MVAEWGECSNGFSNSGPHLNNVDIRKLNHTAPSLYSNNISINQSTNRNASLSTNICHSVNVPTNFLKWENHSSCLVSSIRECASLPSYFDVVLVCNKKSIAVHRTVLSSASAYFKELLVGLPDDVITICVEGFKWSIVVKLVEYMYLGHTYFSLNEFSDLISAGEFLKLQGIENFKKQWLSLYGEKLDLSENNHSVIIPRSDMKRKAFELEDSRYKRSKVQNLSTPQNDANVSSDAAFPNDKTVERIISSDKKYGVKHYPFDRCTSTKRERDLGPLDSYQANNQNNHEETDHRNKADEPLEVTESVKRADIIPIMNNGHLTAPIKYSNGNSLHFSNLLSSTANLASNSQHNKSRDENTHSCKQPKVSILPVNTQSTSKLNSDYKFATILASLSAAREQDMNDVTSKAPMDIYPVMNLESAQLKKIIKRSEDQDDNSSFQFNNNGSRNECDGSRTVYGGSRAENDSSCWTENDDSCTENGGSRADISSSRADISSSRADIGSSRVDISSSRADIGSSRADIGSSRADFGSSRADISSSRADIGSSRADIGSSRADVGSSRADIGSSRADIGSSRADIGSSRADIGSSRVDIGSSRVDIGSSRVDIGSSRADIGSSRADISGLHADGNGFQYTFRTAEEIEAALDVYHRKLAFHEPRPCPSCNRMYRDAATLRTHITIMHSKSSEPFICSCGELFNTKFDMYHHKKNGHYVNNK